MQAQRQRQWVQAQPMQVLSGRPRTSRGWSGCPGSAGGCHAGESGWPNVGWDGSAAATAVAPATTATAGLGCLRFSFDATVTDPAAIAGCAGGAAGATAALGVQAAVSTEVQNWQER